MSEIKDNGETLSEYLAEYCVALSYNDLPGKVIDHAKLLFLDLIGAVLSGSDTPEAGNCIEAMGLFGNFNGCSSLWGTKYQACPSHAALYNAIAAHAREIDDFGGVDHSGAVVIPAVVAIGESKYPFGGKRLIEAMVAGYEIGRRILEASGGYRAHNNHSGWHSTGTCGSFAAAAAVAKALALNVKQTVWAIGLAGSFTGGTWAFSKDGAMSKRYHPGRAAETGVIAASLAMCGFTGPRFVFESDWGGFFNTYAKGSARPHMLTDNLGSEYKILNSGVKPYASCRDTHSAIEAVLEARCKNSLSYEDIEEIEIRCTLETKQMVGHRKFPATVLEAQLSLSYSIAVALVKGCASFLEYTEPCFKDKRIRELFDRVHYVIDPKLPLDSEPVVRISTHDGRVIEKHVEFALGAPQNPLTRHQVEKKFETSVASVLSVEDIQELKQMINSLEDIDDVRILTRLLCK